MAAEPLREEVYDRNDEKPVTRPDLHLLEGGKSSTEPAESEATKKKTDQKKSMSPQSLGKAEGGVGAAGIAGGAGDQVGKGFSSVASKANPASRFRSVFWGTRRRKQATVAGSLAGMGGITAGIIGLSILSGPAQLAQLSHDLQNGLGDSNQQTESRLNDLFRDARAEEKGDIGETRVGIVGSKIFGNTITQLSDVGVTFQRSDITGRVQSVGIDPQKLSKAGGYTQLDGMSPTDQAAFLADKFGISPDLISVLPDGTLSIDSSNFGLTAARVLAKNTLAPLEDGKLVTAIRFRVFSKFFDLPSIFHPLDRAKSAATNKLALAAEDKRETDEAEPAEAEAAAPEEALSSGLSGVKKTASGVLLFTAAACLVRSVADDVVDFNRSAIVTPSTVQAVDKIAVGSQVQTGQDFTASQAGAVVDGFTNSNGQTIWQGQALEALQGTPQSNMDLPQDYKQAFSINTTAQVLDNTIGGGNFGALACSTPGQIVQALGSLGLAISGAVDDGASDVAWGALLAKEGSQAVSTGGVLYLLQHQLVNLLANKAVVPDILSGPLGGNLLAYGAREAGNIGARTGGGIALTATQALVLNNQQQTEENQQFRSESFFARVFDIYDSRSLFGKLADSISPSFARNVGSLASYFTNMGSLIPHIFSSLIPKASADSPPYDWGFPEYGIPQTMMNDPNLSDPYENAGQVASILDANTAASQDYINRAMTCFGVVISKSTGVWDVTPTTEVNPNSAAYAAGNCDDTGDMNWQRIMLFVLDTNTMESTACYSGDGQSCTNIGYQ